MLFSVTTKDDKKMKVHVLAITIKRAKSSQQKFICEAMEKIVIEVASQRIFRDLVEDIVTGKLASTIYHEAKKYIPSQES